MNFLASWGLSFFQICFYNSLLEYSLTRLDDRTNIFPWKFSIPPDILPLVALRHVFICFFFNFFIYLPPSIRKYTKKTLMKINIFYVHETELSSWCRIQGMLSFYLVPLSYVRWWNKFMKNGDTGRKESRCSNSVRKKLNKLVQLMEMNTVREDRN